MSKTSPKESSINNDVPRKLFSYAQKAKQVSQKPSVAAGKNVLVSASQNSFTSLNDSSENLKTVKKPGGNGLRLPRPTKPINTSSSNFGFFSLEQNAVQENNSKSFLIGDITFGSDIKALPKDLELTQNVIISALYSDKNSGLVPFKGIQFHIPEILSNSKMFQKSELNTSQISEKAPSSISSLFSSSKKISIDKIPEFVPRGFSIGKLSANTPSFQMRLKTASNIIPAASILEPVVIPHSSSDSQKSFLSQPILSESLPSSLSLIGTSDLEKVTASSNSVIPTSEVSSLVGAISANPLNSQKIENGIFPLDQIKTFVPKNFVPSNTSLSANAPSFSPLFKSINALPFAPSKSFPPVKIIDPNTKTEVVFENKAVKKDFIVDKPDLGDAMSIKNEGSGGENTLSDISAASDAEITQTSLSLVSGVKKDDSLEKDCTNFESSQPIGSNSQSCVLDSEPKISTILDQEVFSEPISHEHVGFSHSAPASTRVSSPASSDISEPSDIKETFNNEAGSALSPTRVCYDRSFLLKFKDMCLSKPVNFQDSGFIQDDVNTDRSHGHRSSRSSGFGGSKLKTSEERFKASTIQMRSGGSGKGSHGRSSDKSNHKAHSSFSGSRSNSHHNSSNLEKNISIPLEPVEPLKPTENRWTSRKADEEDKEIRVNKKVKSLLNKLTLEKFDSISDQILAIANESEEEKDGETLKLVIKIVFEKATDEPNFSAVYAQLCVKMQSELSEKIKDEDLKNKDGAYFTGGIIFRKYLLTRCQQEFKKGWKDNVATELQSNFDLMSDEYYKVAKAKRQGLGLIRFIGELFKLSMLTEGIMHGCITGMLQKEPDEEEVESICKLMSTIGKQIDTKTSSQQMNAYFANIAKMSQDENLPLRSRFALKNLIDLRKNKWEQKRGDSAGPKTLQEIREDAEQEAEEKQRQEKQRRTASSSSRTHSGSVPRERHDSRDKQRHKDGWNTVNASSFIRGKAGDMSSFGNTSRSKSSFGSTSFSPGNSTVFNSSDSLKNSFKDGSTSKKPVQSSITNMFTMLDDADITPDVATRPIFKLLPRSKDDVPTESNSEQAEQTAEMTQEPNSDDSANEAFTRKVINTINEFWALGDFEEALLSIKEISASNRNYDVIDVFISEAIERKASDVTRLAELFKIASKENVISSDDFFNGAKKVAIKLDDISLDAPAAFDHMAVLLDSYSLDLSQLLLVIESMNAEPNSFPPGPRLFSAIIKHRIVSETEDDLIEEFLVNQCDLTRLYHKDDLTSESLIKLTKSPVLAFLLPSITSADWWKSLNPDTL